MTADSDKQQNTRMHQATNQATRRGGNDLKAVYTISAPLLTRKKENTIV